MDLELFNNTINLLKDGVEIKGSFSATPYGKTIEFKSPNEHLNKVKDEFISVFNKWDDNYQGEDYDEIEKYIEYT